MGILEITKTDNVKNPYKMYCIDELHTVLIKKFDSEEYEIHNYTEEEYKQFLKNNKNQYSKEIKLVAFDEQLLINQFNRAKNQEKEKRYFNNVCKSFLE